MRHPLFQPCGEDFIFGLHLADPAAGEAVKRFKDTSQEKEAQYGKDEEREEKNIHFSASVICPSYSKIEHKSNSFSKTVITRFSARRILRFSSGFRSS